MQNKYLRIFFTCFLGICGLMSVYPLLWLVMNSFKPTTDIMGGSSFALPTSFHWANYHFAVFERGIMNYFMNSFINTILTIILVIVTSTMLAYAVTRMMWKGKAKVLALVTLGILFPSQIVVTQIFVLVRTLGLSDTRWALVLTIGAFNVAFGTLIASAFLRSIPFEMEESAVMDGANAFSMFFRIILPIIKPAIATMAINTFLSSWNEFIYAFVLIRSDNLRTLPTALTMFGNLRYGTDYGALFAAMVISSIIPIIMYIMFSKQLEDALTVGAILK